MSKSRVSKFVDVRKTRKRKIKRAAVKLPDLTNLSNYWSGISCRSRRANVEADRFDSRSHNEGADGLELAGNIQQLENFIERAVLLTRGESLAAPLSELRKVVAEDPAKKPAPAGENRMVRTALLKAKSPKNESGKRRPEKNGILTECKGRVAGLIDPAGEIRVLLYCLSTGQATSFNCPLRGAWSFIATFWITASRISAHSIRGTTRCPCQTGGLEAQS